MDTILLTKSVYSSSVTPHQLIWILIVSHLIRQPALNVRIGITCQVLLAYPSTLIVKITLRMGNVLTATWGIIYWRGNALSVASKRTRIARPSIISTVLNARKDIF